MSRTILPITEIPQSGAELFQFLSSEGAFQETELQEFSEQLIEDCLDWVEAICSTSELETENSDERAEWLYSVERVVRARDRAMESSLTSLKRLGKMLDGKLHQWKQMVHESPGWWMMAGKAPVEPWSWPSSGMTTNELRVDLPDPIVATVIWRWFSAWLHPDDLDFVQTQVRDNVGVWGSNYRQVLCEVCRLSNIMELPIPLSYRLVTRFPTPAGEFVVNRTEQGVLAIPPDKEPVELSWNAEDQIQHWVEVTGGNRVELQYRRIHPDADVETQASLSALASAIAEPDFPFTGAFDIVRAVASMLIGDSSWSEQIHEVARLFRDTDDFVEDEDWKHVARAVQARVLLESISLRYLSGELDSILRRMDQSMAYAANAVLAIPLETYQEILGDTVPTAGTWWSARYDLEQALPDTVLEEALTIDVPEHVGYPIPASSPAESTVQKSKNANDVFVGWFYPAQPSNQMFAQATAETNEINLLEIYEDPKFKVFSADNKLFFHLKKEAFQSANPTLFFRIEGGNDVKSRFLRSDTFVFDRPSIGFIQQKIPYSLILKYGDHLDIIDCLNLMLLEINVHLADSSTRDSPAEQGLEKDEAYGKALYDAGLHQSAKEIWKLDIPLSIENIIRLERITEEETRLPNGVYFPVVDRNISWVLPMLVAAWSAENPTHLSSNSLDAVQNALDCIRKQVSGCPPIDLHLDLPIPSGPPIEGLSLGLATALAMFQWFTDFKIERPVICTGRLLADGTICDVGFLKEKIKIALAELGDDPDGVVLVPRNPGVDDKRIKIVNTLKEAIKLVSPSEKPKAFTGKKVSFKRLDQLFKEPKIQESLKKLPQYQSLRDRLDLIWIIGDRVLHHALVTEGPSGLYGLFTQFLKDLTEDKRDEATRLLNPLSKALHRQIQIILKRDDISEQDVPIELKIPDGLILLFANIDKHLDELRTALRGLVFRDILTNQVKSTTEPVSVERAHHLQKFRAREKLLDKIMQRVKEKEKSGGYVLLQGSKGMGKSALAAKLSEIFSESPDTVIRNEHLTVSNCPWLPGILLHMCRQGGNTRTITLQSLIEQANCMLLEPCKSTNTDVAEYGLPEPKLSSLQPPSPSMFQTSQGHTPSPREAITKNMLLALKQLCTETGRAIFIVDGLDEDGPAVDDWSYLPYPLPAGVVGILTANRDAGALPGLKDRLNPAIVFIGPFEKEEISKVTGYPDETLCGAMYKKYGGIPNYIDKVLSKWNGSPLSANELPNFTEAFEIKENKWHSAGDNEERDPLFQTLLLLSVMKNVGPFSWASIQTYLETLDLILTQNQIKKIMKPVDSDLQSPSDSVLILEETAFAEYILDTVLSPKDQGKLLEAVARWLSVSNKYESKDSPNENLTVLRSRFLCNWADSDRASAKHPKHREIASLLLDNLEKNQPDSKCFIQIFLDYQTNFEKIPSIGIEAMERAVQKDDREAQFRLGWYLVTLKDASKDEIHRGQQLLKLAADHGSNAAQRVYGDLLLEGTRIAPDKVAGEAYLRQSIEQGNNIAKFLFGVHLIEGKLVTRDIPEGLQFLREAATAGFHLAAGYLWSFLLTNKSKSEYPDEAGDWLRKWAENGNLSALRMLGYSLLMGGSIQKNAEEGEAILQDLIKNNDAEACGLLGECKLLGNGIPQDEPTGEALLNRAFELGEIDSLNSLATYYLHIRRPPDPQIAEDYFLKAGQQGSELASATFALNVVWGFFKTLPKERGVALLREAIEKGNASAMAYMGLLITNGKIENAGLTEAESLLRRAVSADEKLFSKAYLSKLLIEKGLPETIQEGRQLLESGVNKVNPFCMYFFGHSLIVGNFIDQNIDHGVHLLQMASNILPKCPLESYDLEIITKVILQDVTAPNYPERIRFLLDLSKKGILQEFESVTIAWNILRNRIKWPEQDLQSVWKKIIELFLSSFQKSDDKNRWGANATFLIRRENVELDVGISIPDLLRPGLEANFPYAFVNEALCHATGFRREKDWIAAEMTMAKLDSGGAEEVVTDCWHHLAKLDDPEGHLVIGWLVHRGLIADPDGWTLEERLNKARTGKWADTPHWNKNNLPSES